LAQQLETLAISGIGERQAEGFGRLAVNWQGAYQLDGLVSQLPSKSDTITLAGQSAKLATQMLERMLRAKLDEKLLERINRARLTRNGMTNTQLARLRTAARTCLEQKSAQGFTVEPLQILLKDMKPTARQQYQKAEIQGKDFETWLKDQIGLDMTAAFWIQWKVDKQRLPTIGRQQALLDEKLAREYTIRFIDGVARQARKGGEHEGH